MATAGVNHWLTDIQRELDKSRVDVVPKGWKTSEQLAKEINRSLSQTRKLLLQARKAGLIEEKTFRIKCGKVIYPIKHCRQRIKPAS